MRKIDVVLTAATTVVLFVSAPAIAGLDGDAGDAIELNTGYRSYKQAAAAASAVAQRERTAAFAASEARANAVRSWERTASLSAYQTRVATTGSFANGLQNLLSGWAIEGATKAQLYRLSGPISEGIARTGARGYLLRINVYRNASNATVPTPNLLELIGPANTPEIAYAVGALGPTSRQAGPSWAWLDTKLSGYLWIARGADGQYKLFSYTGGWAKILEGRGAPYIQDRRRQQQAELSAAGQRLNSRITNARDRSDRTTGDRDRERPSAPARTERDPDKRDHFTSRVDKDGLTVNVSRH